MVAKVKPVQPMEIKDKKIVCQVIMGKDIYGWKVEG
jgi:hypothetical protein